MDRQDDSSIPGKHSFWGIITSIVTGFILLSLLSVILTVVMWESSQCLERILCGALVKRSPGDITKILLKTALNTIQSVNKSQCNLLSYKKTIIHHYNFPAEKLCLLTVRYD